MSSKHTPGPWAAFTDDSGILPHTNIVAVVPVTACVFSLPGRHKNEADVSLIAAAPDLLAALRDALPVLEAMQRVMKRDAALNGMGGDGPVIQAARAALAKALSPAEGGK